MDGRGYLSTLLASAAAVPFTPAWTLAGLPALGDPHPASVKTADPDPYSSSAKPGDEGKLLALASRLEDFRPPPVSRPQRPPDARR